MKKNNLSCKFFSLMLHLAGSERRLIEVNTGKELTPIIQKKNETVFQTEIQPVFYKMFRVV